MTAKNTQPSFSPLLFTISAFGRVTDWGGLFFGEDDDGETTNSRHSRRSCFVISAVGGRDEQWSEAGIQTRRSRVYNESSVAGHNRGEAALFLSLQ